MKGRYGLDIASKWGVASDATLLHQRDFGNPDTNGLPVVSGLVIGGIPVGDDDFAQARLLELVHESVFPRLMLLLNYPRRRSSTFWRVAAVAPCAHNICGRQRTPCRCSEAVSDVDGITAFAIACRHFW